MSVPLWKKELISLFHYSGAVQFGNFTLSSGNKSNVYIDARLVTLDGYGLHYICDGIMSVLYEHNIVADSIGGPTLGADPIIGAMLLRNPEWTGFIARKKNKEHGTQKRVEGLIGDNPFLVEDTVTTGQSLADILDGPIWPSCAIVLVDRLEGATERLAKYAVPLYSLLTIEDLK
jgi:orotate phosphoribosyltransferase